MDTVGTDDRTAVVVVHGLLERTPYDVFEAFTNTALDPRSERRFLPPEITDSYEARRCSSPRTTEQVDVDLFEYHWPFLSTAARHAGLIPAAIRVFLRRPRNVPDPLFGIWRVVWAVLLTPVVAAFVVLTIGWYFLDAGVPAWLVGLVSSAIVLAVGLGVFRLLATALRRSFITTGFVEVARYLDPQPPSYAARRAVRDGLVDLLHSLQQGRYARVVVVGHGVGAFIAYDALTSLWSETHEVHAGPIPDAVESTFDADLRADAIRLLDGDDRQASVDDFRRHQFAEWQEMRHRGNPWRTTDFVTIGTPMALADVLVTRPPIASGLSASDGDRRRALFDTVVRRGALVTCPPRSEHEWSGVLLGPSSPFAVTRWTNLWFPVARGSLRGDWFGGALRPLFGPGIHDVAVQGDRPRRLKRGAAHAEYFTSPGDDDGDVARHLRRALALQPDAALDGLAAAPLPDYDSVPRRVHRSWQRSS